MSDLLAARLAEEFGPDLADLVRRLGEGLEAAHRDLVHRIAQSMEGETK